MTTRRNLLAIAITCICLIAAGVTLASVPQGPPAQRDPLGQLKRAITEANAPVLTTQQETQLTDLIKAFREANRPAPNEAFKTAHAALNAALLAGNQAAIQTQIEVLAALQTAQGKTRLAADAKFKADVLTILRNGGQFEPLKQKLGDDHLVGLAGSLAGGPGFRPGGPGGPGFRPGGPGYSPGGPGGFGERRGKPDGEFNFRLN